MSAIIFAVSTAIMIVAAILMTYQAMQLRKFNAILRGVVRQMQATPPTSSYVALAAAGDRIAHELLWEQNRDILGRWWDLRGGHSACTVCSPQPTIRETILAGSVPSDLPEHQ